MLIEPNWWDWLWLIPAGLLAAILAVLVLAFSVVLAYGAIVGLAAFPAGLLSAWRELWREPRHWDG